MAWLEESLKENFVTEEVSSAMEVMDEASMDLLLEYTDPTRKRALKDACATVRYFLRENGIKVEASKFWINRDFKKGNSNEIKFTFSSDALTYTMIAFLFSAPVACIHDMVVMPGNIEKIKELMAKSKNKEELNKLLKKNISGATVAVKEFSAAKNCLVLTYKG